MGNLHALQALVQRLRSQLPLNVTLTDPFTRAPIQITRENVLAEFVLDSSDLENEANVVAAMYVEFARFERAAEYTADLAAMAYTQWKSERGAEYRNEVNRTAAPKATRGKKADDGEPAARKPATNAEVEEYYRSHDEYAAKRDAEMVLRSYQHLFQACREGMQLKGKLIEARTRTLGAYQGVERNVYNAEERQHRTRSAPAQTQAQPQGDEPRTFQVPSFTPPGAAPTGAPLPGYGPPGYQPPPQGAPAYGPPQPGPGAYQPPAQHGAPYGAPQPQNLPPMPQRG